jgi:voltage-gated potassium channel
VCNCGIVPGVNLITSRFPNRLILALISFVALILVGASGYHWLEGMSVVDSLYMTVITVSTVGFGEVRQLSPYGRMFTIGLILGGGGIAAYSVSVTAEFFMSGEWSKFLEIRRRSRMRSKLSNHIIICGFGRVGRRVAEELTQEGAPFIVVDSDPDRVASAEAHGYICMLGNAANERTLKDAGIDSSRALVATVNSDAENVFIVLTARSLSADLQIIARANYEDSEPKMIRAGANRTIVPYTISGKRMVTMLMRPSVADFLDEVAHVGGLELLLEQVKVEANSPLANKTIAEANLRKKLGVTILACRHTDGKFDTHPGPQTLIDPNGLLLVLGTREQLRDLMRYAKAN